MLAEKRTPPAFLTNSVQSPRKKSPDFSWFKRKNSVEKENICYEMSLAAARKKYPQIENAAKLIEEKLFGEPFHDVNVKIAYLKHNLGEVSSDGKQATLINDTNKWVYKDLPIHE